MAQQPIATLRHRAEQSAVADVGLRPDALRVDTNTTTGILLMAV
jgi:hypothetical protein